MRQITALLTLMIAAQLLRGQSFRVDTVARAPLAQYPNAIAFAPGGGTFFFAEKNSGRIRVFRRFLQPEPFVTVAVENEGEQGLLRIAVHPSYPDSPYVYLYYTRVIDRSNVVERYRDVKGIGVDARMLLIVPRVDDESIHSGGALAFGPDGKLYVAVGDYGSRPDDAQNIQTKRNYLGKILRLNDNGSLPPDNPFPNSFIYSYGHCNPTGITFDEQTGVMYCVEGGGDTRNEVDVVIRGGNLGWPVEEDDGLFRLHLFGDDPLPCLTGIVVYRGSAFPRLRGKFIFGGNGTQLLWVADFTPGGDSLRLEQLHKMPGGFADVKVGPDGNIYLVNGPYLASRILRLVPVAPVFASEPPLDCQQGSEYRYTPGFQGTPPSVSIVAGPVGMLIDTLSWTVRWTPSNEQALAGFHTVTLRAQNGSGYADQTFTLNVRNVNDPPTAPLLVSPRPEELLVFNGAIPEISFRWQKSSDPDGDTVRYVFQVDSTSAFAQPMLSDTVGFTGDSLHLALPRASGRYFWRVLATDGEAVVEGLPHLSEVSVSYVPPLISRVVREPEQDTLATPPVPLPESPANGITYTLRRAGHVRLSVYNLLGQEVAVLFDGSQPEGTYQADFNKAELPRGVYFYRIEGPDFSETRQMIVSK